MEEENQKKDLGNIAHIILIGNPNYDNLTNAETPSDALILNNNLLKKKGDHIIEIFSEIDAFTRLFRIEEQKLLEPEDVSVYLFYESEDYPYRDPIKNFFKYLGFRCKEFNLDFDPYNRDKDGEILKNFEDQIHKISNNHDEILFNITSGNLTVQNFIIKIAPDVDGRIYLLANTGDLIFLPETITQTTSNKQFNYEETMDDSLQFKELSEFGVVNYNIKPKIISNTFKSIKEIQDNAIIIKKKDKNQYHYDIIKLMRINGIEISKNDKFNAFPNKVFEGLSYFGNKIIRLIINNEDGIVIYLGLIISGINLSELLSSIETKIEHFEKLLRAIYPGLEIAKLSEVDLSVILEFIRNKQFFGSLIGNPTETVSSYILRELENALWSEQWGMMTIGESLSNITINNIIKDLNAEIDSILENTPIDMNELDKLNELKNLKEYKDIYNLSSIKIKYLKDLDNIRKYIQNKKDIGLWDTCNYIFTNQKSTYNTIYSILKSNYKSSNNFWVPVKIVMLHKLLTQFPKNLQLISIKRQDPSISNKFQLFHTIYSSKGLGSFIFFPSESLNNFEISKVPAFQSQFPRRIYDSFKNPIKIGTLKNSLRKENSFFMDYNSFSRHCLVMGSTGSGKTNTIMNILSRIREKDEHFPFLIIDPVKKEYRHLRNYFNDLEIYTTGRRVNPLKINLFEVPPFMVYSQWVGELLEIISNTFYIWQPLREIIWNCLNDIYILNGWTEEKRGRTPTLEEFIPFAKLRIDCSDYHARSRDAFKGAIESRFDSLIKGTRGITFKCLKSRPNFKDLLKKPIVIELAGLMNDNEKALIFNLLIKKLYLYRQNLGFSRNLRHISVIEEAHR